MNLAFEVDRTPRGTYHRMSPVQDLMSSSSDSVAAMMSKKDILPLEITKLLFCKARSLLFRLCLLACLEFSSLYGSNGCLDTWCKCLRWPVPYPRSIRDGGINHHD